MIFQILDDKRDCLGLFSNGEFYYGHIKRAFEKTKELFEEINKETNFDMKTLSIGMSGDYKIAIKEGSTLIRVGTAIFGERNRLV